MKEQKKISLTAKPFNDEQAISFNGNLYDIGTKVVRWDHEGGFNGYDTKKSITEYEDRKTGKTKKKVIKGKRYSSRKRKPAGLNQVLCHHTGGFTASRAFQTLHNERKLSVQFIEEDDGKIFQPLDALAIAWQAGKFNKTSTGIEVCSYAAAFKNPEAYSKKRRDRLGVKPHKIIEQYIQGSTKKVFKLPEAQVKALVNLVAGIWAARTIELGALELKNPHGLNFMPDGDGGVLMDYSEDARQHIGLLLHSNASARKWDLAGIEDMKKFEKDAQATYYKFLKAYR